MNERMIVNYVMPHVNMYRVIGAIVIILGLYLVMWGKANDNNSFLSVDQCQIAPARELVNASRNGKENPNHEANTISKWWVTVNSTGKINFSASYKGFRFKSRLHQKLTNVLI